jgi:hypothetical protein
MKILPKEILVGHYVFYNYPPYDGYIIAQVIDAKAYNNNFCQCIKALVLETTSTTHNFNVNSVQFFAIEQSLNSFYTKRSDIDKILIFSNE